MPAIDPAELARDLLNSYTTGQMLPALPSSIDKGFTLATAYAVETEFRRLRTKAGHRVTGRKVGYANKAMWRALKLDTLVWASMYDDTVQTGSELSLKNFMAPRLEPEIVFKLKHSFPSGGCDAATALRHVEWLAPGFEIIDCPFPGWQFTPADFVAAYGLHRALVVGEPCYVDSASIPALVDALPVFKLKLFRNGQLVEEGSGKNSLRSPALCLGELAAALHRNATPLEAGELISSGTLTGAQPIAAGDVWRAEIEGLPISKLEVVARSHDGGSRQA